jgi:hypothetical protein
MAAPTARTLLSLKIKDMLRNTTTYTLDWLWYLVGDGVLFQFQSLLQISFNCHNK